MESARSVALFAFLFLLPCLAMIDPATRWEAWRGARAEARAGALPHSAAHLRESVIAYSAPSSLATPPPAPARSDPETVRGQGAESAVVGRGPTNAQEICDRLVALGALYMRLEEAPAKGAAGPGSRYFFWCEFADPQAEQGRRWFAGEGIDPVSAMRQALFDVDRWQIVRHALLPANESTQY